MFCKFSHCNLKYKALAYNNLFILNKEIPSVLVKFNLSYKI